MSSSHQRDRVVRLIGLITHTALALNCKLNTKDLKCVDSAPSHKGRGITDADVCTLLLRKKGRLKLAKFFSLKFIAKIGSRRN